MCVDFCENLPAPFHKNASVPTTLTKIEREGWGGWGGREGGRSEGERKRSGNRVEREPVK